MNALRVGALALLLAACNPGPAAPLARFWSGRDFSKPTGNFGGFFPSELMARDGASLRFQPGNQTGGDGLILFPAVADRAVVAFVITDIWQAHPEPWVQPVWSPLDENGAQPVGVWNVFPVDVDSTFYSPFWRAEMLLTSGLTPTSFRSGRDVLNAKGERRSGSIILCPIVPDGTRIADDGSGAKEPITLRPVMVPTKTNRAWVDGKEVSYFDFGPDRVQADGQNLREALAYFFVSAAGQRPLPLATVLPAEPKRNSLVRRVDVVIPGGAAPFVPANRPDLRALLLREAPELTVPTVSVTLDAFPQFALRVATDPACFEDPAFPTACDWLDTPARLEALRADRRIVQDVQLAIGVVLP